MNPPFSVVVVTHNSADDLAGLIASLERSQCGATQLVVVDNGSRDDSVQVARAAGAEVVELPDNRGFGAACNVGVELAGEPVTALLNPDVELLDAGISALASRAALEEALFVPRLVGLDGRVQDSAHPVPGRLEALGFALLGPALPPPLRVRAQPWRTRTVRRVGWAIAAVLVGRTEVLRRLGPFDPAAFLFYEDLELCLRAGEHRVPTVLDPAVVLRHRGAHSTGPAFSGEPFELIAARRREVIAARLGRRALILDDLAQALTFATRIAAKRAVGRPSDRERSQLKALRSARRARQHP